MPVGIPPPKPLIISKSDCLVNSRFNMMNNAKNRNSRSVSQEKEIYSDLTENDTPASMNISTREKISSKPYSHKNRSFKGSIDQSHSSSYKFRKKGRSRCERMSDKIKKYELPRQEDIIQEQYYDHHNHIIRKVSKLDQNHFDEYSDDDFYDDDMEEICAIHRKELDMVCLESNCETPVCSKCILVGDHKHHKYIEKEKFFKNLEEDKKRVLAFQGEIQNSEQLLVKKNSNHLILDRINQQKDHFNREIEAHVAKMMRIIDNRKREVEREVQIYFEQMGEKLGNYVNETIDATQSNKDWKRQLDDALRQLNEKESDIESGFHFRKLDQRLKFEENAKRIISNIGELQSLIDKKLSECINSFELKTNDIESSFLEIQKVDVSFKQDLRERMRIVFNNEIEKLSNDKQDIKNNNNFMNMVDEYQDNANRDTDLMNDDFDPSSNNLINDLPEYGMKTQKNNMYGMQMNMQGSNMHSNQSFAFLKNQGIKPMENPHNEYGQIRGSVFVNNNDDNGFYSQSSINNTMPTEFMNRDNRSRSITKNSKKRMNKSKDLSRKGI
jgi:hypothetical protein